MRNQLKDAREMAERRRKMLDCGFALFSERTIESVSMQEIANAAELGIATVYRYYPRKQELVVAVASERWKLVKEEFARETRRTRILEKSVREQFVFYLNCYIDLYLNHKDLLRFNYDFNRYVVANDVETRALADHLDVLDLFRDQFSALYMRGIESGSIRTDLSVDEAFSAITHLMMAAVTRYAVGLVYRSAESSNLRELELLKKMLLREFLSPDGAGL